MSGTPAPSPRERAVFYSMVMGLVHVLPGLVAAMISGSLTLYTVVLRSGTETLAIFFSWRTLRRIARGNLAGYDYGLGKWENLTSMAIVGASVVTVAVMGFNSVQRLSHPVEVHRLGFGVLVTVLSGLVNWVLWHKTRRAAQSEPSPLMESQWRLMRNKFLANAAVTVALVTTMLFGHHPFAQFIDPALSLILCGVIVFSLYSMLAGSLSSLLDRTLEESLQLMILKHLAAFEARYTHFHAIRSRRAGSRIFIDIFLEFDGARRMDAVQADLEAMRDAIERDIPGSCVAIVPSRGQSSSLKGAPCPRK